MIKRLVQDSPLAKLSRREREIMDVAIELKKCSVQEIQQALPDPPSYSTVRALLARMVEKGVLRFSQEGAKYIYSPLMDERRVQQSALARIIKTFFKGSRTQAVNALLDMEAEAITTREIEEIERTIARLKERAKD